MKRWLVASLVGLGTIVTGTLVATHRTATEPVPASPLPPITRADKMLALTNDARVIHGLPKVVASEAANEMAREHSLHMARTQELHHNLDYKWPAWGENVGVGKTVPGLFRAFMHSPGHRAVILDGRYTSVGIGFAHRDAKLWVTMIFFTREGS